MDSNVILVLGATGQSGLAFIEETLQLADPPKLVLYVRNKAKVPETAIQSAEVCVVSGDLADYETLSSAMQQHSVTTVVSFLGAYVSASAVITRAKPTPIADSFPVIIDAMKKSGVRHLMALSTPSYWVEGQDVSTWRLTMYGLMPVIFAPQGNAEMVKIAQEVVSKGDSLDWTIFRIPHLTNEAPDLPVWADYAGPSHKGSLSLSRGSLARWVLTEIKGRKWTKGAPLLGNI
ncbi:unnamed protein product [Clonostachys rhizophaga]|uniref:NAD(P)-binding domain-containing protein n=1 Tax=Clonostachys rhizophaga TaxID=160324 RepID=A0A9N9VST9_9HYPO|nr:unnamed protein product [Clonostachys rhizophaga]